MGKKKIQTVSEKIEVKATTPEIEKPKDSKRSVTKKATQERVHPAKATLKKIRSRKYRKQLDKISGKHFPLTEALELLKQISYTKFDPTVELHFNLSIDPKKSEQIIRKIATIPYGIKKDLKILVFGNEAQIKQAKEAGVKYIGDEAIIAKIKNGWVGFDRVIATPEMMPKITPLARILGPKGLMPNLKNNTITTKVKEVITTLLSGNTIEIKNERDFPIIHTMIGKLSLGTEKLKQNFQAVYETVIRARPPKVKNPYIKSLILKTTMSPSIRLGLESLAKKDLTTQ